MIPVLLTRERKLKTIREFYKTKLNLLNLKCNQEIKELKNSLGDLIDLKYKIYEINKKCD